MYVYIYIYIIYVYIQLSGFLQTFKRTNVSKAMIDHLNFDGLYHPFMLNFGMASYCFTYIIRWGFQSVMKICKYPEGNLISWR